MVIDFADESGLPVTLHVEPFNPVLRLYERLGFAPVEQRGLYQSCGGPAPGGIN